MRWWHMLFPPVVETPQGLFRPSNALLDTWMPALGCLVVAAMTYRQYLANGRFNWFSLFYIGIFLAPAIAGWRLRRRFGPMGKPLVRIDDSVVLLSLPMNVGPGHVQVPLAELRKLVIKGTPGQRSYVFERHAGEPIEVRPGFLRDDARVADFLQRTMPASIPVEVLEPPTFLGAIRGD
ncbi:MAG: hypothetical protein V4679_24610 [Pseudomonadota bacterium]